MHSAVRALDRLIEQGLPPIPQSLPVGEQAALPLALWVGSKAAAALWAWREADPKPVVLLDGFQLAAAEFVYELVVWERSGEGWTFAFASGDEWHGDIGTPPPDPWVERPGWPVRTNVGPFWWGGVVRSGDDDLAIIPGDRPSRGHEDRDAAATLVALVGTDACHRVGWADDVRPAPRGALSPTRRRDRGQR